MPTLSASGIPISTALHSRQRLMRLGSIIVAGFNSALLIKAYGPGSGIIISAFYLLFFAVCYRFNALNNRDCKEDEVKKFAGRIPFLFLSLFPMFLCLRLGFQTGAELKLAELGLSVNMGVSVIGWGLGAGLMMITWITACQAVLWISPTRETQVRLEIEESGVLRRNGLKRLCVVDGEPVMDYGSAYSKQVQTGR